MNADELRRYQEMRREAQRKLAEEKKYYDEAQSAQKQQIETWKNIKTNQGMNPSVASQADDEIKAAKEEMARLAEEWREYQQLTKDNLALAIQIEKDKKRDQEELDREMKKAEEARKKELQKQFESQLKQEDREKAEAEKAIGRVPKGFRGFYNAMTNFGGFGGGNGKGGISGIGGAGGDPSKMDGYSKGLSVAFSRATAAIGAFNMAMDAAAKVLQISNRLYRGQTEQQLAYMRNSPLEAKAAETRMSRDVATSVASAIPLIGGSLSKVIGAAYDKQLAYLERRMQMEAASRDKLADLAMTNGSNAVAYTEMQINRMMMRFQEGQELAPVLKEYSEVQNELDKVRLEKSIKENTRSMKENIREMRDEIKFEKDTAYFMDQGYSQKKAESMAWTYRKLGYDPQTGGKVKEQEFLDVAIKACNVFLDLNMGGNNLDQLYQDMRQEVSKLNSNEVGPGYGDVPEPGPMFGKN